jgi:pimeloyl-ACP methyl ester carboxylesterase
MDDHVVTLKDGRKLGYCEYGDPKGKPIFYFHGWPASRLSGTETHTAAVKLGINVISVDRPGIGLSDYQEGRILLDWADDIAQLADKLKIRKFAIMGVSGGGPYAAVCAYKIPKMITKAAIVVGLSPVNIGIDASVLSFFSIYKFRWFLQFSLIRSMYALTGEIVSKYFPGIGFRAKEDRIILKKKSFRSQKEAFRQGIEGPAWDLKLYTDDWGFKLGDIKTKVYLWYGAKDKNVSVEMGKYYRSQIPNSELVIDPVSGHMGRYNYEEKILRNLIT